MALTRIKTDQIAAGAVTGEAFHTSIDLSGKIIDNLASIGTLTVHGHSGGVVSEIVQTFIITVVNDGYGNIYVVDGVNKPNLNLVQGGVYTFDQSNSSNSNHPIAFKDGNGNSYTSGVVSTGTPGQAGAQTVFTVPNDAPSSLSYYCTVHGDYMGNTISVTSSVVASEFVGQIQLNCSENTHGQLIASQPHSQAASNTLTLPGGTIIGNANAVLVSDTGTQTLINKTISNGILTGTLNAGGATGANGQVLASTGSGVQWVTPVTSSGTVTSVSGTGTVSGLSLSGTVTSSGNLTLGGTLSLTSANVTTALGFTPYNATNPSGFIAQAGARAAVSFTAGSGAYNSTTGVFTIPTNTNQLTNGAGFTTTTGTVTSVSLSGGTTGLTVSGGPITTSGTITLSGTLAVANGGTGVTTSTGTGSVVRSISPTFAGTSVFNNISVNGGSLTSTAATFNLVNTNTTTLNIGAAATALNLGSSAEGATATFAKNVTIIGNLTVQGTTTTEASAALSVSDSVVNLNEGATTNSRDIGLIGEYKPSTVTLYTGFVKDASDGVWKIFSAPTSAPTPGTTVDFTGATFDPLRIGALTATNGTFTSALTYGGVTLSNAVTGTGNMVLSNSPTLVSPALGTPSSGSLVNCTFPTLNQNTTGSAATLTTARLIGGVSFNGSANINLPGVNVAGNQNTTGNAATATGLQTARTINGVSFNGTAAITLPTVNTAGDQTISGLKTFSVDAVIHGHTLGRGAGAILSNTAFGFNALISNTTGSHNAATGINALRFNTTGLFNTANGVSSLQNNTTGLDNSAIGGNSLLSNTIGSQNSANGAFALSSNTTGDNNTGVGSFALGSSVSGSNNVALGANSGAAIETGSGNTIIGAGIPGSSNLTNTVIIGAGTTEKLRIDSSGNVGIGTSSPGFKVDLHGPAGVGLQVLETSTGTNKRLIVQQNSTGVLYNATFGTGNNAHVFAVGNTERLRIDSSGTSHYIDNVRVRVTDFYSYRNTAISASGIYVHLKTDIDVSSRNQMYSIHFQGHSYGEAKPINTNLVFYSYVPSNNAINIGSSGTHTATAYKSVDNKVVLRIFFSNFYFVGFTLSLLNTAQSGIPHVPAIVANAANDVAINF